MPITSATARSKYGDSGRRAVADTGNNGVDKNLGVTTRTRMYSFESRGPQGGAHAENTRRATDADAAHRRRPSTAGNVRRGIVRVKKETTGEEENNFRPADRVAAVAGASGRSFGVDDRTQGEEENTADARDFNFVTHLGVVDISKVGNILKYNGTCNKKSYFLLP